MGLLLSQIDTQLIFTFTKHVPLVHSTQKIGDALKDEEIVWKNLNDMLRGVKQDYKLLDTG